MHQAPAVNGIRSVALQRALVKLSDPADVETEMLLCGTLDLKDFTDNQTMKY